MFVTYRAGDTFPSQKPQEKLANMPNIRHAAAAADLFTHDMLL